MEHERLIVENAAETAEPLARITGRAAHGVDPDDFPIAPIEAANKALAAAAPAVIPTPTPSVTVIADQLGQLTALLGAVVAQGRLDPSRETVEHRSRLSLARRIAVLLAAHGPLTRSALTRLKLSKVQSDAMTDALEYALGLGAIRAGERRRFVLVDAELLGLDTATVKAEVELIEQRRREREAREANREIERHRDKVLAR